MNTRRRDRKKRLFLEAYREKGAVRPAARSVNIHRATIYRWRKADYQFDNEMENVHQDNVDEVEATLLSKSDQR
jgi:transposase-like protein